MFRIAVARHPNSEQMIRFDVAGCRVLSSIVHKVILSLFESINPVSPHVT